MVLGVRVRVRVGVGVRVRVRVGRRALSPRLLVDDTLRVLCRAVVGAPPGGVELVRVRVRVRVRVGVRVGVGVGAGFRVGVRVRVRVRVRVGFDPRSRRRLGGLAALAVEPLVATRPEAKLCLE